MTAGQQIALTQAAIARQQRLQQAQQGLDAANPGQLVADQIAADRSNAMEDMSPWQPFEEAVNQYQDKGGKVNLSPALQSIRGLDAAGAGSQQPGQVVTDTGNPPVAPGVQGGAGDGGSNGVGVSHTPNMNGTPVPTDVATPPTGIDGLPAPKTGGGPGQATLTQKNARMPASMKGLGY